MTVFSHSAESIKYMFRDGKLYFVRTTFKDDDGSKYGSLKENLTKMYGEPVQVFGSVYKWTGGKTRVVVSWVSSGPDAASKHQCILEFTDSRK